MKKRVFLLLLLSIIFSGSVYAQIIPDAGRVLQDQKMPPQIPAESPGLVVSPPKTVEPQEGGAQIQISSVSIDGSSMYTEAELLAIIGPVQGQAYDLAGLKHIAEDLSDFYHKTGYPFARAYLPKQKIEDGVLKISIVEGRYGAVTAKGDEAVAEVAQEFLSDLKPGEVIQSDSLERATLILGDQPGIKATPIIRPGQEIGTGDLNVDVVRERGVTGDVGFDNYGNRYTGEYRGKADLTVNSPFFFGDQFQFQAMLTDEILWLGSGSYNLPIGTSGLRGQLGYAQTTYQLGAAFEDLKAKGYAKITTAGLSYPLVRSQAINLSVLGLYQHKDLQDKQDSTSTETNKYSDSAPAIAQFDVRDQLLGGGITYGSTTWTHGHLHLDAPSTATDRASAHTQGDFDKINLDIVRLQSLPARFSFYQRFSGQWTNNNLDSSESFGLGGANGVRAYSVGEGYGARGWLTQSELRYTIGDFTPYAFYDSGAIRTNVKTWDASVNERSLAGSGAGVRYNGDWFALDASLAWRLHGGEPQSDTEDRTPRGWVSMSVKF